MSLTLYPTSPSVDSKKLTALPSSYKLRASLAVVAILLFFVLYFGLVAAFGYLAYYAFIYDMGNVNKLTILLKIGAIASSVMLFIFTLKFIFKLKNHKRENRIQLKKEDHPDLWLFIDNICNETGAPRPKAIYIDPDVNAYVSYSNMWLSLFLPVKKELTIGLGLVSCLNLSEFKAVVTHEFGHFAQSSMKIGSYIISANTIIHDMIFSRDKWDDILDQWRGSDIRVSFAAWIITPIIWLIRQLLSLFYQFLNIMYSSLSREMEFNADKVAVTTSGSDAIVSALWKLDDGSKNWNDTMNNAYLALQKNIFTKNLYTHNNLAITRSLQDQAQRLDALPEDKRGGKIYFSSSENSKAGMYASHPPNDVREQNAKTPYIACDEDSRSPWLLFNNDEAIQEQMTTLVYKTYLAKELGNTNDIEEMEHFIAQETKGKNIQNEYLNTFENRFLNVPEISKEDNTISIPSIDGPIYLKINQLKKDLVRLTEPIKKIEALMQKAVEISNGTTKEKTFTYNHTTYKKKNINEGYERLVAERDRLFTETFKEWDHSFVHYHLALARKIGEEKLLNSKYVQHHTIALIYKALVECKKTITNLIVEIQSKSEVTHVHISNYERKIKEAYRALNPYMESIDDISFVALPNIDSKEELKNAIIENGVFNAPIGKLFETKGLNTLMTELETSLEHCQRVEQKSINAILLFQKKILEENTPNKN